MFDVTIRRSTDSSLIPVNIAALAVQVSGDLQVPDQESRINGHARAPAVIVRCANVDDALQCLDFASRLGLLISMHNSHQNPSEWSDCDNGIAVDLSGLSRQLRN